MTDLTGAFGSAFHIELPDIPESAETVTSYLITAPPYHPLWSQYLLAVVRLRDIEGFPPPKHQFEGSTHELLVCALDPSEGPYTQESLKPYLHNGRLPILTPINIAQQHEATDDEMTQLAHFAVAAVIHGSLCPETADAPSIIRENWLASATKTLAHIRGEEHSSD